MLLSRLFWGRAHSRLVTPALRRWCGSARPQNAVAGACRSSSVACRGAATHAKGASNSIRNNRTALHVLQQYRCLQHSVARPAQIIGDDATLSELLQAKAPSPARALQYMRANANESNEEGVWELMKHLVDCGVEPAREHYLLWLGCARKPKMKAAIIGEMARTGHKVDAELLLVPIKHAITQKRFNDFHTYLAWFQLYNVPLTSRVLGQMFELLAEFRLIQLAEQVRTFARSKGFIPDAVAATALFTLYSYYRRHDKVLELYNEMVASPVKITSGLYTVAISSLIESPYLAQAQQIFDCIPRQPGLVHMLQHFTALIGVYGAAGEVDMAFSVFNAMKAKLKVPDLVTYSALLQACATARDTDRARQVWQLMEAEGLCPNEKCWLAYIEAHLVDLDDMTAVKKLTQDMVVSTQTQPGTVYYDMLLKAYASAGRMLEAERLFEKKLSDGLQVTSGMYTSLLAAYVDIGDSDRALSIYADMLHNSRFIRNDPRPFNEVMRLHLAAESYEGILEVCQKMLHLNFLLDEDSFAYALRAFVATGRFSHALTTVATEMPKHICEPKSLHFGILVDALRAACDEITHAGALEEEGSSLPSTSGGGSSCVVRLARALGFESEDGMWKGLSQLNDLLSGSNNDKHNHERTSSHSTSTHRKSRTRQDRGFLVHNQWDEQQKRLVGLQDNLITLISTIRTIS